MGGFECGDDLLARHRWKGVEKLVDAVAPFEVVDQVAQGTRAPTNTGVPPKISGSLWIIAVAVMPAVDPISDTYIIVTEELCPGRRGVFASTVAGAREGKIGCR
jgi:hypothetical protein